MVIETALAIGDANLGSENKNCALVRHGVGEVERCHRIHPMIVGEALYLARQLLVFSRQAHRRIPRGG